MNVQEIASSATLFCTLLAFCLLICFFNGGKSLGKGGNDDLKDRKTAAACRNFSFFTYFCSLILRPAQSIYKFTMYTIMETTLVLLKPSCVQRNLIGEIVSRFERRGLQIVGMKMMQLSDQILREHYAHLTSKPFFPALAGSMQTSPVVALALRGVDAVQVVRIQTYDNNISKQAGGEMVKMKYWLRRKKVLVQRRYKCKNCGYIQNHIDTCLNCMHNSWQDVSIYTYSYYRVITLD